MVHPMGRIRRKLAAVGIAASLAIGGGAVAVATAGPAAAATYSYGNCYRIFGTSNGECLVTRTPNWFEWLQGQRTYSYWEFEPGMYNTVYGW